MRWRRAAPVVLVLASLVTLLTAQRGRAVPLYAAYTGLPCGTCHFDPNGGGPRNEFGFNFAKNRHRIEPESGKPWSDVQLSNRVSESLPLYVGVDHRLMLLSDQTKTIPGIDRVGFYNMENAFHLTFQPHKMLTLVYTRDGFDDGSKSQDAFGLISGGALGLYLKAGRFRTPFGLRMDDHTVATRNGFLDFLSSGGSDSRYLPYDPRTPDMGLEIGAEDNGFFGRASFTNGESHPLGFVGGTRAQAKAVKLGYNNSAYQGGISFYDDFRDAPVVFGPFRSTRWDYYGMTHWRRVALLLEAGAGTDAFAGDVKNNLKAGFAELDWAPQRSLNLRVRADRLDLGEQPLQTESVVYNRYAFEGEWVPVPFAELRASVRRIEPVNSGVDETQEYLQFHFTY